MAEFFEVLKTRRTVRAYTDQPVQQEELHDLIRMAVLAPSGMNAQPWAFTVVTKQDVLRKLNGIVKDFLRTPAIQQVMQSYGMADRINHPDYSIFYNAPALVVISGDKSNPVAMADCHLAAENLFLAAHARGLGTCYMGFLTMVRDNPTVKDLLGIPEGHEMMAAAIVGHPAGPPDGPPKRNPPRVEWVR
jgi:nitroreductase